MPTRLPLALRNARADLVVDALDAGPGPGTVKVYTGPQPSAPEDAPTGTLLVTITLPDPAFSSATGGVAMGNNPGPAVAVADGTAGWFRAADSTGVPVHDGTATVTGGGGQLQLATVDLTTGAVVDVTLYAWTEVA